MVRKFGTPVELPGDPASDLHAAPKQYVDTGLAGKSDTGHTHSYQPLDSDLTAIAALAPADGSYLQRASGVWVSRTATETLADLGAVPTSRTLTASTGLSGGGDLTTNRSFAVSYGTTAGTAVQGNDTRVAADQAAGTASIRTLGTGATQAAAGNHTHAAYPLGIIARGRYTTAISTTGTTPTTARKVTELPAALTSGRLYRIAAANVPITNVTSTANVCFLQITHTTDGTTPSTTSTRLASSSTGSPSTATYVECSLSCLYAPASSVTIKVLLAFYGQAGTTWLGAATDWPVEVVIEDVGPDPGVGGTNF